MRAFRLAVPASDLARSRRFYEQVLDMPADDTVPSRLYFHCGAFIVAVIDWGAEGYSGGPMHVLPDHLYLATDGLDAAYGRAVEAGATVDSPIEERPWGERSFYIRDPDGHRLCFVDDSTLFLGHGQEWS